MEPYAEVVPGVGETLDEFSGIISSQEVQSPALLGRQGYSRRICVPVATSLVLTFVVTVVSAFISTCRKRFALLPQKYGGPEALSLGRRLAILESQYTLTNGHIMSSSAARPVGAVSLRRGSGSADGVASVEHASLSRGKASWRRLSESSSDGRGASRFSDLHSDITHLESLVDEMCQESSVDSDNLFVALLDLERGETLQGPVPETEVLELGDITGENVHRKTEGYHFYEVPSYSSTQSVFDCALSDLMNPDFPPVETVNIEGFSEPREDLEIFKHGVARGNDPGNDFKSEEPGVSGEFKNSAAHQYSSLLHIYEGAFSSNTHSKISQTVTLPPEAVLHSQTPKAPKCSTAYEAYVAALSNVPQLPCASEMAAVYSKSPSWDVTVLTIATKQKHKGKKNKLNILRRILSLPKLSPEECVAVLSAGIRVVALMREVPSTKRGLSRLSIFERAELLGSSVITLDALLWVTETFPDFTNRAKWWQTMLDKTNMSGALNIESKCDSLYQRMIDGCLAELPGLMAQRRASPKTMAWITQFYDEHLSRGAASFLEFSSSKATALEGPKEWLLKTRHWLGEGKVAESTFSSSDTTRIQRRQKNSDKPSEDGNVLSLTNGNGLSLQEESASEETDETSLVQRQDKASSFGVTASISHGTGEGVETEHASASFRAALANVPRLPAGEDLKALLRQTPQWSVKSDSIGCKYNPQKSRENVETAEKVLSNASLSLSDCIHLLSLGERIIFTFRPIKYEDPLSRSWTPKARARALALLVKRLDALFRITELFPTVTRREEWWSDLFKKANIDVALKTEVRHHSLYYQMVIWSKRALFMLRRQMRPDIRILCWLSKSYSIITAADSPLPWKSSGNGRRV